MRLLITSSRNPFALDLVRKLAEQGHTVYACDTFNAAAGSHSKYLAGHEVTASPRHETPKFISDVEAIVERHQIDMVVPCFEEAFYLATRHAQLSAHHQALHRPVRPARPAARQGQLPEDGGAGRRAHPPHARRPR